MTNKIFIDIDKPSNIYSFEHVIVICPNKPATSVQLKLLKAFNKAGLKSVTPGGKWLPDSEYSYTTLIFKASSNETINDVYTKIISIVKAFEPSFEISSATDDIITETVNATTIDTINALIKTAFQSLPDVKGNPFMNIIYDTTLNVETGEMEIFAYTTADASENDTTYLKDVFKTLKTEIGKRSDVEKVKQSYCAKSDIYYLTFNIVEPTERLAERFSKSTLAAIKKFIKEEADSSIDSVDDTEDIVDGVEIELWPAILQDQDDTLAVVVANTSLNKFDNNDDIVDNFEEGCKKLRETELIFSDEDTDEQLADDLYSDDYVVVRAPDTVEVDDMFDWVDKVGRTLEAVGFDVTVNMTPYTTKDEFEVLSEPAAVN